MKAAKWLLFSLLALPVAELGAFILVAVGIGAGNALVLLIALSLVGWLVVRYAGGAHIARLRTAFGEGRVTALQADGRGTLILAAGILLLVPGFITGAAGLLLLVPPVRRWLGGALLRGVERRTRTARQGGVVDLAPDEWRPISQETINDQRETTGNSHENKRD